MAPVIDLREFQDASFVIQFQGPAGAISAETLSDTLLGFEQALKAINSIVNPGTGVELIVDDISPGSVRIGVAIRNLALSGMLIVGGALAAPAAKTLGKDILVELLGNYLYDKLLGSPEVCKVDITESAYTIEGNNCKVTISREAAQFIPDVNASPKVAAGVKKAIDAAAKDPSVEAVGVTERSGYSPGIAIPRDQFEEVKKRIDRRRRVALQREVANVAVDSIISEVPTKRTRPRRAHLTVIKAVLKRGTRKWQFNWQGIPVSAPIKDASFFDALESRAIALRQGDALDAEMLITQEFIAEANVWQNVSYEVVKVYAVTLGDTQTTMDLATPPPPTPKPPGDTQAVD
jgi:hypothetical protein